MWTEIDKWFEEKEAEGSYGTYHHTLERDTEDVYVVDADDFYEFARMLVEEYPDMAYMSVQLHKDQIVFEPKDLEESVWF